MANVDIYTPLTTLIKGRLAGRGRVTLQDSVGEVLQWAVGEVYLTASALTTIPGVDTPTKAAGTTAVSTQFTPVGFTGAVNNRLTFVGVEPKIVRVFANASIQAVASLKNFNAYIAKNGVVAVESKSPRLMSPAGDIGHVSSACGLFLSSGDFVELWIENTSDGTNATVQGLNLFATQAAVPI